MRMDDLARDYRQLIGPCPLVLYLKSTREGRPIALYWGRAFRRQAPDGSILRLRAHLPGRLSAKTIYRVAYRHADRDLFKDFDRRRLDLNREHARIARALGRVLRSLRYLAPDPSDAPAPVSDLVSRATRALLTVEREMIVTVRQYRHLSPLFPYVTKRRNGAISVGWAIPWTLVRYGEPISGRRHVSSRLYREILLRLKIPRPAWSALRAIDRRMRELRKEHARYAHALGKVRRILRAVA